MIDDNFIPLLLVLGLFALLWDTRRDHPRVRMAVTLVPAVLWVPYLFWRVGSTLQAAGGQGWQAQVLKSRARPWRPMLPPPDGRDAR